MSGENRPTTVRLVQLQVRATSPDGSMNRNTGSIEQPRCANTGELGYLRYQMRPRPYIRDAYLYISGAARKSSQTYNSWSRS